MDTSTIARALKGCLMTCTLVCSALLLAYLGLLWIVADFGHAVIGIILGSAGVYLARHVRRYIATYEAREPQTPMQTPHDLRADNIVALRPRTPAALAEPEQPQRRRRQQTQRAQQIRRPGRAEDQTTATQHSPAPAAPTPAPAPTREPAFIGHKQVGWYDENGDFIPLGKPPLSPTQTGS